MKPHIYRLARGVVLHQIQSFSRQKGWSPPAKGDTPADAYLAAELVRGW